MRKKLVILTAAAVAGMLVLTACTSSENASTQSVTGAVTQTGGGDSAGAASDGASEIQGSNTTDGSSDAQNVSGTAIDQTVSGTAGTGTTAPSETASSGEMEDPIQIGEPVEDGGPVGDVIPDEYADAAGQDTEDESETGADDIWSGTYIGEEESVTIVYLDEETISFSFAQAGISGRAEVDGYQAVYKGDDYHVVVFTVNDDIITVTVSNEEDYDASASPLIGTYVKEQS